MNGCQFVSHSSCSEFLCLNKSLFLFIWKPFLVHTKALPCLYNNYFLVYREVFLRLYKSFPCLYKLSFSCLYKSLSFVLKPPPVTPVVARLMVYCWLHRASNIHRNHANNLVCWAPTLESDYASLMMF